MEKNKTLIILGIITGLLFLLISLLVILNITYTFDNSIYNFISKFINDNNTRIFKTITSFGNTYVLMPLALIVAIILFIKRTNIIYGLMLIITLESSHTLVIILKSIFERERPNILRLVTENSYSFPSSHSLVSMCFYGFLIYIIGNLFKGKKKYIIQALLGLFILIIGISRIYLGVHYASDVLAGFSIGFTWLVICILITKKIKI